MVRGQYRQYICDAHEAVVGAYEQAPPGCAPRRHLVGSLRSTTLQPNTPTGQETAASRPVDEEDGADEYICDICKQTFDTQRGCSVHESHAHDGESLKPWQDEEVLKRLYYDQELRQWEIAERLGTSLRTVCRWMNKHGLEVYRTERSGESNREERATFITRRDGYERAMTNCDGDIKSVRIHRLLATLKYDVESVANGVIHHKNSIPWDNRLENLELFESHSKHMEHHHDEWWGEE